MVKEVGQKAEAIAARFLVERGYKILAQNLSFAFGELDLVAQEAKTVVFIEVKYRRNLDYGYPFEAVGKSKQRKIILAAKAFLSSYPSLPACRFDVMSLHGDLKNPQIEHIIDAFWE